MEQWNCAAFCFQLIADTVNALAKLFDILLSSLLLISLDNDSLILSKFVCQPFAV